MRLILARMSIFACYSGARSLCFSVCRSPSEEQGYAGGGGIRSERHGAVVPHLICEVKMARFGAGLWFDLDFGGGNVLCPMHVREMCVHLTNNSATYAFVSSTKFSEGKSTDLTRSRS